MINAEDFLNDDDSALGRPRWIDTIGIELVAVAGSQFEVRSHGWNPFVLRKIQCAGSGCRGGVLPPGVASSAALLNMAKVSGRAGMRSLGIFHLFSFKMFPAELSSSSESAGSLFFTARDSIIAPTKPLNKAMACCLASCSSPPICAAIISRYVPMPLTKAV